VSDRILNKISAYSLRSGRLVQQFSIPDDGPTPDRLVYNRGELVGMHYDSGTVYRFHISPPSMGEEHAGAVLTSQAIHLGNSIGANGIALAGSLIYILANRSSRIYALPVYGNTVSTLPYIGMAQDVTAIVGTFSRVSRLVLADQATHKFTVLQATVPATIYLRGERAPQSLAVLYSYLQERKLLPLKTYTVRDTDHDLSSILKANAVVPFGYSADLENVICKLNKYTCHDGKAIVTPGARLP
jgi:hypothetical protein